MALKCALAAASLASTAIASNTTAAFTLRITGKEDKSIDGYVGACHAGAAIEAMCYNEGSANTSSKSAQFYYDYSSYDSDSGEVYQPGFISWLLEYQDQDGNTQTQKEPLQFIPSWGSNVAQGLFQPTEEYTYIYFTDKEDTPKTLYMSGGYDDSHFNATPPNPPPMLPDLENWHLCYQYNGGYYYRSIAWVFTQPPQNPSCEPVDLTIEFIESN